MLKIVIAKSVSFFKKKYVILFISGSAGLFSGCREPWATLRFSVWASHCDGLFCWGAGALGDRAAVVVAHGLNFCGSWVHRPNCSAACGIFPDQRLNLCLLHWQADSLPGTPQDLFLITPLFGSLVCFYYLFFVFCFQLCFVSFYTWLFLCPDFITYQIIKMYGPIWCYLPLERTCGFGRWLRR